MWFSEVLKNYRDKKGFTRLQMTELIQNNNTTFSRLNEGAYYRWEKAKVEPSDHRKCQVLLALGLKQCVYRISAKLSQKHKKLTEYIDTKYYTPLSYEFFYRENTLKYEVTHFVNPSVYPDMCLNTQEKTYGTRSPKKFVKEVISCSKIRQFSCFVIPAAHQVVGHLGVSINSVQALEGLLRKYHTNLSAGSIAKTCKISLCTEVLFLIDSYASTREIFEQQLSILTRFLLNHKKIKYVYIRCYDDNLALILCKLYRGTVTHKKYSDAEDSSSWTGILFDAASFIMGQFSLEEGLKNNRCLACNYGICHSGNVTS